MTRSFSGGRPAGGRFSGGWLAGVRSAGVRSAGSRIAALAVLAAAAGAGAAAGDPVGGDCRAVAESAFGDTGSFAEFWRAHDDCMDSRGGGAGRSIVLVDAPETGAGGGVPSLKMEVPEWLYRAMLEASEAGYLGNVMLEEEAPAAVGQIGLEAAPVEIERLVIEPDAWILRDGLMMDDLGGGQQ